MSMVMFVIGCIAVMVGAVMVAFGIPVNEFSFGNTLIVAGTTLATGGLIVVALSAAVSQLQRIAEALGGRLPAQPMRAAEVPELPPEARPSRMPFPPRSAMREPRPVERPIAPPVPAELETEEHPGQSFAPVLRNPEAPPVTVEEEVSLSPPQPNGSGGAEPRHEPALDTGWRSPPAPPPHEAPTSYFDSMWPAKPRTVPAAAEPQPAPKPEAPPRERESVARAPASEPPAAQPRTVPILKSGVVDGMAYTLYVDGSIEAELPQGTLRFASIDELRSHLEKNG